MPVVKDGGEGFTRVHMCECVRVRVRVRVVMSVHVLAGTERRGTWQQ